MGFDYSEYGFYLAVLSVVLTIVVPLFYVQFTIKSQFRDSYNEALRKMLNEMRSNSRKMHNFHNDLIIISSRWRDRNNSELTYLEKAPSFGLHRFILHYLPSKAYYNFMNQGYFSRLEGGRLEHLMEFYVRCIHFSENTTPIEVCINRLTKSSPNFEQDLNVLIQQLDDEYSRQTHNFDSHYDAFNPGNLDGLEIRHWYNV
jgi:hypothetical protein